MSMTLDGRLQDAIREASPRSRPRLHHYLVSIGLAQFIRDLDEATRDNLYLVGDLALHSSFVEYMLAKQRPPNVGIAFCNTIKKRTFSGEIAASLMNTANPKLLQRHSAGFLSHCWLVFVGAMTQHLSSDDFFAWFIATYGPLLDAEAVAYTDYVEEYACEESLLDLTADATPGKTSKPKDARYKQTDPKNISANIESFFAAFDSLDSDSAETDIKTAADPTPSSPSEREVAELIWAEDTNTETIVGRLNLVDPLLFSSNTSPSPLSRSPSEQSIADMLLLETDDDGDTTTAPSSFASSPSQDEIQSFLSIPPTPMGAIEDVERNVSPANPSTLNDNSNGIGRSGSARRKRLLPPTTLRKSTTPSNPDPSSNTTNSASPPVSKGSSASSSRPPSHSSSLSAVAASSQSPTSDMPPSSRLKRRARHSSGPSYPLSLSETTTHSASTPSPAVLALRNFSAPHGAFFSPAGSYSISRASQADRGYGRPAPR